MSRVADENHSSRLPNVAHDFLGGPEMDRFRILQGAQCDRHRCAEVGKSLAEQLGVVRGHTSDRRIRVQLGRQVGQPLAKGKQGDKPARIGLVRRGDEISCVSKEKKNHTLEGRGASVFSLPLLDSFCNAATSFW